MACEINARKIYVSIRFVHNILQTIGRINVPHSMGGFVQRIYLDHNSTTPISLEVAEVIAECYRAGYANSASQHAAGRRARRVLENAREGIGRILGARIGTNDDDRVIFTSGGTESNNLAIRGLPRQPGRVLVSAIEHPSVTAAAEQLSLHNFQIQTIPTDRQGVIDLDYVQQHLDEQTQLVSVMLGNNETGVLQPVEEVARLCRQAHVTLHTDAVQVVGKLPVDFGQLAVDAMSISAHKFSGPRGIGALVLRKGVHLEPSLVGGYQQLGMRPGTEPVELAVGMHKALELWQQEADERATRMRTLRDRLEAVLLSSDIPVVVNGSESRLPNTSNVSFPGLDRQALLMALDMAGVQCSTGSACASGSSEPSPVLAAMNCPTEVLAGSIRISLGATTSQAEIDEATSRILSVVRDLHQQRKSKKSAVPARE